MALCEPLQVFVDVESFSLLFCAKFRCRGRTLCGFRVCRSALIVVPCEVSTSSANLLQVSCVSKRSHCGAMRIFHFVRERSAGFVRVDTLSLWRRVNFQRALRTLSQFSAGACAGAWSVLRIRFGIDLPLAVFRGWQRCHVERSGILFGVDGRLASVLRVLFVIDDPLVGLGGWRCCCVERP